MIDSLILLLVLLIVVSQVYLLIRSWYWWWRIRQRGVKITAKVLSVREGKGNILKSRWITYAFDTVDPDSGRHRAYMATRAVNWPSYWHAETMSTIDISYLPNNPNVSLVVGDNFERNIVTLVCLAILLIFVIIAVNSTLPS